MSLIQDISIDDIRLEVLDLAAGEAAFLLSMDRLRNGLLQVPPFKDSVEWIFENITLTKSKTWRPGPMRLTVYQRELARCLMDSGVDEINVLRGVQVGRSRLSSSAGFTSRERVANELGNEAAEIDLENAGSKARYEGLVLSYSVFHPQTAGAATLAAAMYAGDDDPTEAEQDVAAIEQAAVEEEIEKLPPASTTSTEPARKFEEAETAVSPVA